MFMVHALCSDQRFCNLTSTLRCSGASLALAVIELTACRVAAEPVQPAAAAAPAPASLDASTLDAVKQALEALFQDQSVVTMPDVRVWLQVRLSRLFSWCPRDQACTCA